MEQAIGLLEKDFNSGFAAHPWPKSIDDKLIFAYQQNQDWQLAFADNWIDLWRPSPQSEEGRASPSNWQRKYFK